MALLKMSITLSMMEKEIIEKHALLCGESRSSFIRKAINFYIDRHNTGVKK
jgi:hypothetical protein